MTAASTVPTVEELLVLEAAHPRHTSTKELTIRRDLGISPARFYQLLHRAVLNGTATPIDPMTAGRVHERLTRTR